eukprot:CAMPEP_0178495274 /NCGR_PEP_ID=MMETSP0696-20121128/13455_1 /TAXON_ID=265572 /ORGANISM="Extubocellulus spinifer, Strain CCMP396" /LENGTH=287 /DNA_ID=CAMNT_0020123397 /DNA_START=710 /DNA_END=1573 /DNA_ORIENTATION=-
MKCPSSFRDLHANHRKLADGQAYQADSVPTSTPIPEEELKLAQFETTLSKKSINYMEDVSRLENLVRKRGGDDKETQELRARDRRASSPHAHLPEDQSYKHSSNGVSKEQYDSYLAELDAMSEEEVAEFDARLSKLISKCTEHESWLEKLGRKCGGNDKDALELHGRDDRESSPHAHLPEDQSYKHSSNGMSKEKYDSYLAQLNAMSEEEVAEVAARISKLNINCTELESRLEKLERKCRGNDKDALELHGPSRRFVRTTYHTVPPGTFGEKDEREEVGGVRSGTTL